MSDFIFAPCFRGISAVSLGESSSPMYFGRYLKKLFVVVKQKFLIVMVVLYSEESYRSAQDFFEAASFNDEYVIRGVKIAESGSDTFGENESEGNLWNLSNILQFYTGKGLCKDFIFIRFAQNCEKVLIILPSCDSTRSAFEEKALSLLESYFIPQMQVTTEASDFGNDLRKSCSRKTNVISDKIAGRIYIWPENGRDYLLNVSDIHLLAVFNFESEECVMLSYLNGKLIFIFYNKLMDYACKSVAYLAKKLVTIQKFNFSGCAGFVWSDGIDLYLSKVDFHYNKPCFVKLVHLQKIEKIEGIKTMLKCKQCLLVVTLNNSYYLSDTSKMGHFKEIKLSSADYLLELHKCALKISQLKKEIKAMAEFLKNKEVMEEKGFNLGSKESEIVLKCKVRGKLDKNYWKVRLSTKIKNKLIVEVKDFEADLGYGMTSKIESDEVLGGRVKISIIGDFGNRFKALLVNLGCIKKDIQDVKRKTITKNLCNVAKNRKTNLIA